MKTKIDAEGVLREGARRLLLLLLHMYVGGFELLAETRCWSYWSSSSVRLQQCLHSDATAMSKFETVILVSRSISTH